MFGKTWKQRVKIIMREILESSLRFRAYQMVSPPVGKRGINDPITGASDAMRPYSLFTSKGTHE